MRVGILGLGSMGQPMARRVGQAGCRVVGFNRTRSRAEALQRDGVEVADTPEQACDVDLLISMVTDDEAIEQLFWQDGRFLTMGRPGLVHAGMSTISDTLAARLAAAHRQYGQSYVSAPVFGPPDAAQSGKLYIAAAGDETVIHRCPPAPKGLAPVPLIRTDPPAPAQGNLGAWFPRRSCRRRCTDPCAARSPSSFWPAVKPSSTHSSKVR